MQYYCTLFDSAYLSRGLAMYRSLLAQTLDFHLYIFPFDEQCYEALSMIHLPNTTIVPLPIFESEELLRIKPTRSKGEYCWTCTPSIIWHCLHAYALEHCTYVDADLFFYTDPAVLYQEMGTHAVLITPHRYSPAYDQSALSGIYCVQYLTFRNNPNGMKVLNWWRQACIDWCFNRFEDGKFGDQKYLDDWTTRFEGIHVVQHTGGGVAPWNNADYDFEKDPLIFYHFHDFRYCRQGVFRLTNEMYTLAPQVIRQLYAPYVQKLLSIEKELQTIDPNVTCHEAPLPLKWINEVIGRRISFFIKGYYKNYFKQQQLGKFN